MPLTINGFERLNFDDVLNLQIQRAKLLFGEDIDTSEQSTFGKILRLNCLDVAENQELAEGIYLSAFPHSASGVSLDRLCPFVGIALTNAENGFVKIQNNGFVKCNVSANVGDKIGIINCSIAVVTANEIGVVKSVIAGNAYAKLK